jgi:hypothetical protein
MTPPAHSLNTYPSPRSHRDPRRLRSSYVETIERLARNFTAMPAMRPGGRRGDDHHAHIWRRHRRLVLLPNLCGSLARVEAA